MTDAPITRLSTGVTGLDEVLEGGLLKNRAYLVRGQAGTGKTTLGLHFLLAAPETNNLFISFGESPVQVRANAESMNMNTDSINFLDLSPGSQFFSEVKVYDIFSAAEVEREPVTTSIVDAIKEYQPERVFIDAITQLHYLASDSFDFRRYAMAFLRFMKEQNITLLFTSEQSASITDDELQFISDGIIQLEYTTRGRNLTIEKFRGSGFRDGPHTVRLTAAGMQVYPRLIEPERIEMVFTSESISSGVPQIDQMLHGGLERGTVTLLSGPTGVGKTTLGIQFMSNAAREGKRSVVFTFEEDDRTIIERCNGLNIPIEDMLESGLLTLYQIEPLRYTPDEFAHMVQVEVEQRNATIVMIDSVSGYELSLQGDNLMRHLHTQCKYLRNMGTTTILVNEVHRIVDSFRATEINISYLMDSIVFLRYFESGSELRRAIGVLKKRISDFEKTMREIRFTSQGIWVGQPLGMLQGILTGVYRAVEDED